MLPCTRAQLFTSAAGVGAALGVVVALVAPAQAAPSTCWLIPPSGAMTQGFYCDLTSRTNYNGHIVHDISRRADGGARFTAVLWTDGGGNPDYAEVVVNGQVYRKAWWRDAQGDVRIDVDTAGVFVF